MIEKEQTTRGFSSSADPAVFFRIHAVDPLQPGLEVRVSFSRSGLGHNERGRSGEVFPQQFLDRAPL